MASQYEVSEHIAHKVFSIFVFFAGDGLKCVNCGLTKTV
jgi:hypothetical protein